MKELKTLKDIKWVDRPGLILRNDARSEAIKWVKEERVIKENLKEGLLDIYTAEQRWMKRLNIKEEDLK